MTAHSRWKSLAFVLGTVLIASACSTGGSGASGGTVTLHALFMKQAAVDHRLPR